MTAFPSYSTGTVAVAVNGTVVTGAGTIWSGINVRAGDEIVVTAQSLTAAQQTQAQTNLGVGPVALNALLQPNVSASASTTTGTIAAASAALTLTAALDFKNNQGIRINHAGAATTAAATARQVLTVVGTAGTATYTYAVYAFDANCGVGLSGGTRDRRLPSSMRRGA